MPIGSLAEVRCRLEEAVKSLPDDGHDFIDKVEMVAFQVLDARFAEFPPGVLERYLSIYLDLIRLEIEFDTQPHLENPP
jgi:hypothetical protein